MTTNSQSSNTIIDIACKLFQDQDKARFWPSPLVRELEKINPRLALKWAVLLFQELLPLRRKVGLEKQQMEWLVELTSMIDKNDIADLCNNMAQSIWNNSIGLNIVERGIARLYWALQNYQIGLVDPDYYLQITSAVAMLADNGGTAKNQDEETFKVGIELYRRLVTGE